MPHQRLQKSDDLNEDQQHVYIVWTVVLTQLVCYVIITDAKIK